MPKTIIVCSSLSKKVNFLFLLNNRLEELCLDRNKVTDLPQSLGRLSHLKSLQLSQNYLAEIPAFLSKMKTIGLMVSKTLFILNHKIDLFRQPGSSLPEPRP